MKKVISSVLVLSFVSSSLMAATHTSKDKDQSSMLCQIFEMKAKAYKVAMPKDTYRAATLSFYAKQSQKYCQR